MIKKNFTFSVVIIFVSLLIVGCSKSQSSNLDNYKGDVTEYSSEFKNLEESYVALFDIQSINIAFL